MRITGLRIGSFGRIRDREFRVSPGMTVFHGPNESGKTTVMEFIRGTLVPTRKNSYPARAKTDFGSVLYGDGPGEGEVTLVSRTRGGDVPECISGLDPDLYRSVYSLDAATLNDSRMLESGELGQSFLTVPGSRELVQALDGLAAETDSLLGKTRGSDSELMRVEKELGSVESRISELRRNAEQYGVLSEERKSLEAELLDLEAAGRESMERSDLYKKHSSQKENYDKLADLRGQRSSLGGFVPVTPQGEECYLRLKADRDAKRQVRDTAAEACKAEKQRLDGTDPKRINDCRLRMEDAVANMSLYRSRSEHTSVRPREEPVYREKPDMRLLLLGAVIALAGLAGSVFSPYALAAAGVGIAVAAVGLIRKVKVRVPSEPVSAEDYSAELEAYRREVEEITRMLGRNHTTVEADVMSMKMLLEAHTAFRSAESAHRAAREAYNQADMAMMQFTNGFGGEERFLKSLERSREAARLDSAIGELSAAIRACGLDPDDPVCPVEAAETDNSRQLEVSRRIGEIGIRLESLLDMRELDGLMDRRAALKARHSEVLREGAVCYLATLIGGAVCDEAYGDLHPGVIGTADRYLSMMTGGRYRFDTDPRNKGVTVRDAEGTKDLSQCSTGLRAQVLLSVKLAVARELGGGKVPVVLDDVLLPFDSERKLGALKALSEVSSEMQVLLFTCDDQVRDFALSEGIDVLTM